MTFLVVSHSLADHTKLIQCANVTVWKVYPDGSEELVRGVDMIGTPLLTFSRIKAASETQQVFNGSCGAESGWAPVSAIAPDLLVSEVEVQRRDKGTNRPSACAPHCWRCTMITPTGQRIGLHGAPDAFLLKHHSQKLPALALELPDQPKPHWIQGPRNR